MNGNIKQQLIKLIDSRIEEFFNKRQPIFFINESSSLLEISKFYNVNYDTLLSICELWESDSFFTEKSVVEKIITYDKSSAISFPELCNALHRCGRAAKDAAVSFDGLLYLITRINEKTSESGMYIGNALKHFITITNREYFPMQFIFLGGGLNLVQSNFLIKIGALASLYQNGNNAQKKNIEGMIGAFYLKVLKAIY